MAAKWRHIRWQNTSQVVSHGMDYCLPKVEIWIFISFWVIAQKKMVQIDRFSLVLASKCIMGRIRQL